MANQELLTYIIQQEQGGYSEEQIRSSLAGNGYAKKDINAAFKQLGPAKHDDEIHGYAQQYARQESTAVQAFSHLIEQGYKPNQARKAVNDAYGKGSIKAEGHLATIVFVLIALLIGASGTYLMLDVTEVPTQQPAPLNPEQTLSQTEIIAEVLELTRQDKDAGVQSCHDRLVGGHREQCLAVVAVAASDNAICTQIVDPRIHDSCLMNFLNDDFDGVCSRVQLTDNKETCESIKALQAV